MTLLHRIQKLVAVSLVALAGCGPDGPGGGNPPPGVIHDCADGTFTDRSAIDAARRVAFGGVEGSGSFSYSPSCMVISAGQQVTFVGNFGDHPLVKGEFNGNGGSANNPIIGKSSGSGEHPITFNATGDYPFYCQSHAPSMAGMVRVK